MINDFFAIEPYSLSKQEKENLLKNELIELTEFHKAHCIEYSNFLDAIKYDRSMVNSIFDIPFYPVRMFKMFDLLSVPRENIFKTMTSSGTTGQRVSKIFVDKETAMNQQKAMIKILSDFWGKKRLPMLIVDSQKTVCDRTKFSARGAAIMGLNVAAKEMKFVLNEDMSLNFDEMDKFLQKYKGERIVIFGFTFIVWQHFYKELIKSGKKYDLSECYLMTGGGWKKLQSEAISLNEFKECFKNNFGLTHFLDHYGMVEQTGCIYAECEYGHLHASNYSDVIIRNYKDFSPCEIGEKGIIQVLSVLPHSYPGHSLLTEDEGMILGEDNCPCGRKGKYISITGRMKSAELRGCSDTYADQYDRK
ncbi:MAG: acyl-protein synthetase [Lachnospiraceae bacterium]